MYGIKQGNIGHARFFTLKRGQMLRNIIPDTGNNPNACYIYR